VTIATIFEIEAKQASVTRRAALVELAAMTNIVLATGGGVVIRPRTASDSGRTGWSSICMRRPDALRPHAAQPHRPLLNTADRAARLVELYTARDPLYREVPVASSNRDATRSPSSRASSRPRSRTRSTRER